jgi:hypothetical protein
MKALLTALAITTLAMTGCVAGPYEASYQYQGRNQSYQVQPQPVYYAEPMQHPIYQSYNQCDVMNSPSYYIQQPVRQGRVLTDHYSVAISSLVPQR